METLKSVQLFLKHPAAFAVEVTLNRNYPR
jgi:hypothetical protein